MKHNIFSDPARRLLGRKKHPKKYLFILFVVAILLWFPNLLVNQYSFGVVGAGGGNAGVIIRTGISSWWERLFNREEITVLKQEKESLLQENALLKEKLKEKEIEFKNEDISLSYNILEVPVIGKDNFLDTPIIFLFGGKDLGLRSGMPVLDSHGSLVGTIKDSQQKISQALLTLNHDSRVGARIAGTDWDGVVEGNRDLRAVLEMLSLESQFKIGDQVVTDNRNPDIPSGILIGTIFLIKESDDRLFKEAVVNLPWDNSKLDKVWVVTGQK